MINTVLMHLKLVRHFGESKRLLQNWIGLKANKWLAWAGGRLRRVEKLVALAKIHRNTSVDMSD